MRAVFVELPAFERHRPEYLDDDEFRALQNFLMNHPEAGEIRFQVRADYANSGLVTRDAEKANVADYG